MLWLKEVKKERKNIKEVKEKEGTSKERKKERRNSTCTLHRYEITFVIKTNAYAYAGHKDSVIRENELMN